MFKHVFPMAPMDALNIALTLAMAPLPLIFIGFGALTMTTGMPGTPIIAFILPAGIGGLILLLYAGILFWARPLRFELSPDGMRVVWPLRDRLVPLHDIVSVEEVTRAEFRARYGWGMRIGAGGFLGGFGWASTSKGLLHLYVSRVDYAVLVHVRGDKSWMITPGSPAAFVTAARSLIPSGTAGP